MHAFQASSVSARDGGIFRETTNPAHVVLCSSDQKEWPLRATFGLLEHFADMAAGICPLKGFAAIQLMRRFV